MKPIKITLRRSFINESEYDRYTVHTVTTIKGLKRVHEQASGEGHYGRLLFASVQDALSMGFYKSRDGIYYHPEYLDSLPAYLLAEDV